jgi:hypothetical protein
VTWVSNGAISSRKDGVVFHILCFFVIFVQFRCKGTTPNCQKLSVSQEKCKKNAEM